MEYDCLVNRLENLMDDLGLNKPGLGESDLRRRILLLETICDLRAAYCSFCNKILLRGPAGVTDAVAVNVDKHNNKMYRCMLCTSAAATATATATATASASASAGAVRRTT
jgi:hypothetical protein